MDFTETEAQAVLAELATKILHDAATPERLRPAEATCREGGDGVDAEAWSALAAAGILDALAEPVPVAEGGATGVVDAALVCRGHGGTLAPVPLWSTAAAALAVRHALDGDTDGGGCRALEAIAGAGQRATVAFAEPGRTDPLDVATVDEGGLLTGTKAVVPDGAHASLAVTAGTSVADGPGLYLLALDAPGVARERVVTTDRRAAAHLHLDAATAVRLGGLAELAWALAAARTLVCATQAGVCGQAVEDTAAFLGTRHQFGRPLASFQAPVHRLVDAHVDTDALWLTTLLAAWRLDQGLDASSAVHVAGWWAADAGSRAVHTTQHLHGGIGADVDYPIHRSFLWAKQLADTLGGASSHLADLGGLLAQAAVR